MCFNVISNNNLSICWIVIGHGETCLNKFLCLEQLICNALHHHKIKNWLVSVAVAGKVKLC